MYVLFRVAIMTNKLYSMYFKMGQSMPNGAMLPTIEFVYYYAEHLLLTLITLSFQLLNLQKNLKFNLFSQTAPMVKIDFARLDMLCLEQWLLNLPSLFYVFKVI